MTIIVQYVLPALISFGVTCAVALVFALVLCLGRYGCSCGWCKDKWREYEVLGTCREDQYSSTDPLCSNERCPVCLEDFKSNDNVTVTECSHGFHRRCLLQCLEGSPDCPLCKFKVSAAKPEYSTFLYPGGARHY